MLTPHFADLVHHHFDDIHDAAAFFHVQPITVQRWLSGEVPVNPMAEKLMNIHARGYLPLDYRWNGFKVHFDRATLITPERREFNPKGLLETPKGQIEQFDVFCFHVQQIIIRAVRLRIS